MTQIFPLVILLGLGCLALAAEVVWREAGRVFNGMFCLIGVLLTAFLCGDFLIFGPVSGALPFAGALQFDAYALVCAVIFCLALALSLFLQIQDDEIRCGEVYSLAIFSVVGMLLMVSALDLFTLFLGLEVMSLAVYALAGSRRTDVRSNEAALKYFVLGAFSSGIFLYGIALCYGVAGGVDYAAVSKAVAYEPSALFLAAMLFVLAGFAFKVALVPFHMWTADVYEGAPTAITSLMATGVKAAGFAGFLRVLLGAFPGLYADWAAVLCVIGALTMTVANVVSLAQTSVKRMLAYSSIAHAGYLTLALVGSISGNDQEAVSALLFYLFTYTLMTAGAFSVVWWMELNCEGEDRARYGGLVWKRPWLSLAMSIFLLSLAGIPPTAGFVAKFMVFSSALKVGFPWIVVVAVVNSIISLGYYLRPLVWMFMEEDTAPEIIRPRVIPALTAVLLIVCVFGTLSLGLIPKDPLAFVARAGNLISFLASN